jgi:mono/diheme cytochrome c family protein
MAAPFLHSQAAPSPEDNLGRAEEDIPFAEDVAFFEEDFELELGAHIADGTAEWVAPDSDAFLRSGLIEPHRLANGRAVYALQCQGCHGAIGDGAGPASRHLIPRPRNFRGGLFKFTSTDTGGRPLRRDLFRVVTNGLSGASMPDFRLLSEEKRWDVVEYVRYLSIRGEFEQLMLDSAWDEEELPDSEELAEIVYERWSDERQRAVYPTAAEPPNDAASVARGETLFIDPASANCAACHGDKGLGDGPTADAYNDDWGYPIRPRNFAAGVFRVGSEAADIYRSVATGISGTPMGAFGNSVPPEDIWHIVHYVQHLAAQGGAR